MPTKKSLIIFYFDKFIILIIGILCLIYLFSVYQITIMLLVVTVLTIIGFGYMSKELLLLPIDLIYGICKTTVIIKECIGSERFEFFLKKHCSFWKVVNEDTEFLLIVPCEMSKDSLKLSFSEKAQKYEIEYFRFSKILLRINQSHLNHQSGDGSTV